MFFFHRYRKKRAAMPKREISDENEDVHTAIEVRFVIWSCIKTIFSKMLLSPLLFYHRHHLKRRKPVSSNLSHFFVA